MQVETTPRVLLAEDDAELCSLMTDYFATHGFAMEVAHNGRDALRRALQDAFDLVILDVMMPVLDGFEVLRQVRKRSAVPVIMLTARTAQGDRIDGLNAGADDYLPKPFAPEELLARIRAVLRRTGKQDRNGDPWIECGSLRIKPGAREVWLRGEPLALTSIEFEILEILARSPGRIVSRDALAAAIHHREMGPFERSMDVHISNLRKKLGKDEETLIQTIRGAGYRLAFRP